MVVIQSLYQVIIIITTNYCLVGLIFIYKIHIDILIDLFHDNIELELTVLSLIQTNNDCILVNIQK